MPPNRNCFATAFILRLLLLLDKVAISALPSGFAGIFDASGAVNMSAYFYRGECRLIELIMSIAMPVDVMSPMASATPRFFSLAAFAAFIFAVLY